MGTGLLGLAIVCALSGSVLVCAWCLVWPAWGGDRVVGSGGGATWVEGFGSL